MLLCLLLCDERLALLAVILLDLCAQTAQRFLAQVQIHFRGRGVALQVCENLFVILQKGVQLGLLGLEGGLLLYESRLVLFQSRLLSGDRVELCLDAADQLCVMVGNILHELDLVEEVGEVLRAQHDLQRADVAGDIDGLDALAENLHVRLDLFVRGVDRSLLLLDIAVEESDLLVAYLDLLGHGLDLTDDRVDLALLLLNSGVAVLKLGAVLLLLSFQLSLTRFQFLDRGGIRGDHARRQYHACKQYG